ncbi:MULTISPECIES: histidine ammonia-lyase [Bosea]|uniref:histidine ammonia-lyase n=1 Tax=Bosea TaxID=85413 RepID=UPI00214FAE8C|nr:MULTISPECIES: histidine ammonia-lyase [Bosea]MCR4522851.1 histidine ammonia-lyase [Bosea sp. 47.2.35]MDR6826622.1 histidine ammonia-lyase [Bosea robiniae]MDR6893332.1 histidine ammonia-lyase [Bosea sp. BE109]MDR7136969.1 histidine ammonia-lyase [Bosea sp. BE168]MDR7173668.1 histidine ammonia-lyase [Bosea sp. BE271]
MTTVSLNPGAAHLTDWRAILDGAVASLGGESAKNIASGQKIVEEIVAAGTVTYGVNTGFGKLASVRIADADLAKLQSNLIVSHAVGTGPALPDGVVRLLLAMKAASLARGASGVRPVVIEALTNALKADALPVIPAKGSVGASGDLAPLAHMTAALMGFGEIRLKGETLPATDALKRAGLSTLALGAKEGLALINGTQVSTTLAMTGLAAIARVFDAALVAGALSVDALKGSDTPFDPRIQNLRGQPGQIKVAKILLDLIAGSAIRESHRHGDTKVQDPYSLRCQPQVMGAVRDLIGNAAATLSIEANAVTDNPLVLGPGEIVSGGNFHAEPVAFAADILAMAVCEIGNLSERRMALLVDPVMSGLPPFLARDAGLNSGFMIAQVTAAALASENKQKAYPASVDTIPTSANQEDHVSMATHGAFRLIDMAKNAASVIGVELMAAAEAIEHHRPLKTSARLEPVLALLRSKIAPLTEDRYLAPELAAATEFVLSGAVGKAAGLDSFAECSA